MTLKIIGWIRRLIAVVSPPKNWQIPVVVILIRHAQWRWDWVAAANAVGFHSPAEALRTLGTSIQKSQEAIAELVRILAMAIFFSIIRWNKPSNLFYLYAFIEKRSGYMFRISAVLMLFIILGSCSSVRYIKPLKTREFTFQRLLLPQIDSLGNKMPEHVALFEYALNKTTIFLAVAKDTLKPEYVSLMLVSKDTSAINRPVIYDSSGRSICFDNKSYAGYDCSIKNYSSKSVAEISWDMFGNICGLDSICMSTSHDTVYLSNVIVSHLKTLQRYLNERNPSDPPVDNPKDDMVPPVILKKIMPVYPEVALDIHLEGSVMVKIWVDKKGLVREAEILKSTNKIFNSVALEAVRQWTFVPAKILGMPVAVWLSLPFKFSYQPGKKSWGIY